MAAPVPTRKKQSNSEIRWKSIAILVLALFCIAVVFPSYVNSAIAWVNKQTNIGVPQLPTRGFSLGLDLQGGAHLVYQADTSDIPLTDQGDAVQAVRDVIERRVRGGLGVTEPLVQTTRVGEDYRIIIELPGIASSSEAIAMIGETPVLEFREENNEPARALTPTEKEELEAFNKDAETKAFEALRTLQGGKDFAEVALEYSDDNPSKNNGGDWGYVNSTGQPEIYSWARDKSEGTLSTQPIISNSGFNILKRGQERQGEKQVSAAHLLLCYSGAERCHDPQYTQEEALAKATELKEQATVENFAELVKEFSTEPGAGDRGGELGFFGTGQMVAPFELAVWDEPVETFIGPVETEFGYHVIYKQAEKTDPEYQVFNVFIATRTDADIVPPPDPWKATGLSGKNLKRSEVTQHTQTGQIQVNLNFDDEGSDLFAELTQRNINKQIAIFLDGIIISAPLVNQEITSGSAVISGSFTVAEARELTRNLNLGALPLPIELVSQQKVAATLGQESLQKSFKAGLLGLLLVVIFMLLYYRLPGLLATASLIVYTLIVLTIFKLASVTLTLAGMAGFILSVGMAVDANILVFERLKEELSKGRGLRSGVEEAFIRAWTSIRDGNITTLISCMFLIWLGGFVKSFAVVLAIGVLVSMFSAVTITRTILRLVVSWYHGDGGWLFKNKTQEEDHLTGNP